VVAMQEELNNFTRNEVWHLVPRPNQNVVGTKWVFRNVTPQVFIFRSTTSTDLCTQYHWIKQILNFNHPRLSRF
jgi:hypothetical protein